MCQILQIWMAAWSGSSRKTRWGEYTPTSNAGYTIERDRRGAWAASNRRTCRNCRVYGRGGCHGLSRGRRRKTKFKEGGWGDGRGNGRYPVLDMVRIRVLLAKFRKGRRGDGHRTRGELKNLLRCLKKSGHLCTLFF